MSEPSQLTVQVGAGPDADAEEVAELTARLRRELLELDVDAVEPISAGPPPAGAKGIDALAIGSLLVTLATSSKLTAVIDTIRGWLGNHRQRTVKVQIDGDVLEVSGASSEQQQQLIDDWMSRHASG